MQRGDDNGEEEDVACVRSRAEHGGEAVVADLTSALSRQGDAPAMQTADSDTDHVHAQDHAGNMHPVACAAERSEDMGQENMGQEERLQGQGPQRLANACASTLMTLMKPSS